MIKKLICLLLGHKMSFINPYKLFRGSDGKMKVLIKSHNPCQRCLKNITRISEEWETIAVIKGQAEYD